MQLLLESGALCERDTFQGERCLYNALNDRIRNLLLEYDYSKSTDPLQPLAAHVTSLLGRGHPKTSDIVVQAADRSFHLHKFLLAARSPYFAKKLGAGALGSSQRPPEWLRLPASIPPQSFEVALRYLYLGDIPQNVGGGPGTGHSEEEVLEGIDKLSRHLNVRQLWSDVLESDDRRLARQRRTDQIEQGRDHLEAWFRQNVIQHKVVTSDDKAAEIRWPSKNFVFADVLLRAEIGERFGVLVRRGILIAENEEISSPQPKTRIPVGPVPTLHESSSVLFPAHRAMLLRSEFFSAMFSSSFRESQPLDYLQVVPVDCAPAVLEIVLRFLYTESTDIPLNLALDVLYAADLLLIDKLKARAAVIISTLGSGDGDEEIDVYAVLHAAWLLHIPRLEEFAARFFAHRLERFIDTADFENAVKESAGRIRKRQETDTIELVDDIRYYLSERFRLRFQDTGIDDMLEQQDEVRVEAQTKSLHVDSGNDIRTLDGNTVPDELEEDARNYDILLEKIDSLLARLGLDA